MVKKELKKTLNSMTTWEKQEVLINYIHIEIDVFGRENFHHFKSYCGQIKDDNKYNVYSNYRYCLAVENNSENNS